MQNPQTKTRDREHYVFDDANDNIDIAKLIDKKNFGLDGLDLLKAIPSNSIPMVVFDPQFDHLLSAMRYGNKHGTGRQAARKALPQQSAMDIWKFGQEISRVLKPSGHVSMWCDTFILATTIPLEVFTTTDGACDLHCVDLIVHDKMRMGMGARSRHQCEFLLTFQKNPKRAKGIWKNHGIRDVWSEAVVKEHPHSKPLKLQATLIECLTDPSDIVVDPTAGGFSTMVAAHSVGRRFLGAELLPENHPALNPRGV